MTRAATISAVLGNLFILLFSIASEGCDRLKRNNPDPSKEAQTEAKREQAACGSASAGDRLKNLIFNEAIARRNGDHSNLDLLADYSIARLQDPVVKGSDLKLEITRCNGRIILEVPPGAERAFSGEHELQAAIDYTAQASADGAGFVYRENGAEPIVARLAAFNLEAGAYRPPPAIDEAQTPTKLAEQTATRETMATSPTPDTPAAPPQSIRPRQQIQSRPLNRLSSVRPDEQESSERRQPTLPGNSEATVRSFYNALSAGNGAAASLQVIPEKRSTRAFSPQAISRFYRRLPEPLRLTSIVRGDGGEYRVTYRYSAGRSRCNGRAIVKLTTRGGRDFIRSIQSLSGC